MMTWIFADGFIQKIFDVKKLIGTINLHYISHLFLTGIY